MSVTYLKTTAIGEGLVYFRTEVY